MQKKVMKPPLRVKHHFWVNYPFKVTPLVGVAVLTWEFEPLGHLPQVAPAGFRCLGVRLRLLRLLLLLCWAVRVGKRLLRSGERWAGGSQGGREDAAKGEQRKKKIQRQMVKEFLHLSLLLLLLLLFRGVHNTGLNSLPWTPQSDTYLSIVTVISFSVFRTTGIQHWHSSSSVTPSLCLKIKWKLCSLWSVWLQLEP